MSCISRSEEFHIYNFTCVIPICSPAAPPELNPLEHEELPMGTPTWRDAPDTFSAVPETPRERQHGSFNLVTPLPLSFVKPNDFVTLCRARMDNRDVILRTLKGNIL